MRYRCSCWPITPRSPKAPTSISRATWLRASPSSDDRPGGLCQDGRHPPSLTRSAGVPAMYEPHLIPGMIEPVEQQMLTDLAADPFIPEHGAIVEFGTFFGRSTTCLIKGASRWWSPERPPAVYAFDSFTCIGDQG